MSTITAAMVNELRAKTGQGMMECKKMLSETGGDIEKAIEAFRKKGIKTSIAERAATEGRVAVAATADHARGAAVEIVCNTDFTAKSDALAALAEKAVAKLLAAPGVDLKNQGDIKDAIVASSQTTGENVQIGRTVELVAQPGGSIGSYLYSVGGKGKIAVLVSITGSRDEDLIRQLCMHIAAAKPLALTRDKVPADIVAKERDIAVDQAKQSGKPQQIAEKIAEGKMNAFFAERVLLDQEFINPEAYKGKVSDMLKAKGITLAAYERLEVGQ